MSDTLVGRPFVIISQDRIYNGASGLNIKVIKIPTGYTIPHLTGNILSARDQIWKGVDNPSTHIISGAMFKKHDMRIQSNGDNNTCLT